MTGPSAPLLEVTAELCDRYQIADLRYFLESCRVFAREPLNIAVFGRFKAGKSSFLNHLLGRPLLPVGAIPVTSVITRIEFGSNEGAEVRFLDGRAEQIPPERIADFITEAANPGNAKQVASVYLEAPSMERYRGISFIDTPGLDSVYTHNTDASMEWLPNTGLALVAVGVDPPLSAHDIELILNLSRFTPNISVLLTKVDTLAEDERAEVAGYVSGQLGRHWNGSVPVFPYSIRPGFEHLREQLDRQLLSRVRAEAGQQHAAILRHKAESLAAECRGYLNVALWAAESADSEREQLRQRIIGQKESLDDSRTALRLVARHAAAGARAAFEEILRRDEASVRQRLLDDLQREFPKWTRSLRTAMECFDEWLRAAVTREMAALSRQHRSEFLEPARRASRQLSQSLQDFRDRLAKQTLAISVPLETTQIELTTRDPRAPDIRVGRIFDHNWELLSAAAPMSLLQGAVRHHFERRVADVVFMNISRLASQWEEAVGAALVNLEKDSIQRFDTLIATIEKLIASARRDAPRIREDLSRLQSP